MVVRFSKRILFLFVLAFTQMSFAGWNSIHSAYPTQPSLNILESTDQKTIVEVVLPGFHSQDLLINGAAFKQISAPGMVPMNLKGEADLPQFSFDLAIPFGTQPFVKVMEVDSVDFNVGAIAPSKGALTRNMNPSEIPFEFGSSYFSSVRSSAQIVHSTHSFIMRDVRGLNVTLTPFSYQHDTQTLKVATRVKLEISNVGRSLGMFNIQKSLNTEFKALYESHFVNYTKVDTRDLQNIVKDTGTILIVSPEQFITAMKPFVDWKKRRGFNVKMVSLESLGPKTFTSIKNAVVADYNERALSYLILIGDAELTPFHPGKTGNANRMEADPMYGLIAGNDNYPELFVSRMAVKTVAELNVMLTKAINYEASPDTVGTWYTRTLGIGSSEDGGTGLIDWQRVDLLHEMMLKWHYTEADKAYDPGANATQVSKSVNKGVGWINYIGHGSETSWGTTYFNNNNIDQLTNTGMLPVIVSVACVNGKFNYSKDSFAERWTKAGTVEKPTGAVSIYASSTNQSWVEPTVGQKAIVELMTQDKLTTTGALFTHGSIAVLEANMSQSVQTFETWHNFGDATLQIRTKVPTEIKMQSSQWVNSTTMAVDALEAGLSVVAMKGDDVMAKGVTDATGKVELVFSAEPEMNQVTEVVLTGFNKIPLRVTMN
jgi:gingipain R